MYKYLKNFTDEVYFVCNERSEGHIINNLISEIPEQTKLFIAVDSSSNDVESMKTLTERGIDCLIIDHHTVTVNNPYAILVNPQQEGCRYSNKNACGGLLTYKVCQVIDDYMNTYYSNDFIDLPGFAIMADMMLMTELENRYFAKLSLTNLHHKGLRELFTQMNYDINKLTSTDFLFGASPAITAATRADNIQLAIDFLMCKGIDLQIKEYAKQLIKHNEERKKKQYEAVKKLADGVDDSNKVIIAVDSSLGKGINGLVAQSLTQKFYRPSIVLGYDDSGRTYSGSFRGLEDFSMLELLENCENASYVAGHPGAGGVQLYIENLDALQQELDQKLCDFQPDNSLYYDLEIDVNEVNEKLINYINDFYCICGNGFKPGRFLIKGLFISDKKQMGKLNDTVKIDCGNIQLMKFKTDEDYYNNIPVFSEIEAVGTLNMNYWKQYKPKSKVTKIMQLFIDDYRVVE
jgi:Single-stranded DNA-specific exonuclease